MQSPIRTLIRKDLILHKAAFLGFTPVLVVYTAWLAGEISSRNTFITFCCLYSVVLPMVLIARDDKSRAGMFLCSLPVTRAQLTRAKYVLSWCLALLCMLGSFALYSVFGPEPPSAIWSTAAMGRALLLLTFGLGFMLPFLVRFGWLGLIVGLVGLQVVGIVLLQVVRVLAPELHLKHVFDAISRFFEDAQSSLGDPLYAAAALSTFGLVGLGSYKVAVFLHERKEY